jgi:RHS repeat-associated protein
MKPSITIRIALCLLLTLATTPAIADSLTYDAVGNVATRTTSFGTTTYTYDAVNRLTSETGPIGNFSYSYDANGSRLSDSGGSYTYRATSNRLTARHGHAVTTDAAGNITADGLGHTYVYNQRGYLSEARLNGVLLATYYYDYRGLRTRKVTTAAAPQGAQVVRFVYDEAGHLIEELGTSGAPIRTYVWRDDTPIAQIDHVPTRHIRYFATDHLDTPRAAMDETGKVIWRWESDAFGSTPANEDPDGDGVKTTVNLRFPGQYYDQETGLYYNWHRYYDPEMGQYTQSDPIGLAGGSFSTFAYVRGNPISRKDLKGLDDWESFGQWVQQPGFNPNPQAKQVQTFSCEVSCNIEYAGLCTLGMAAKEFGLVGGTVALGYAGSCQLAKLTACHEACKVKQCPAN